MNKISNTIREFNKMEQGTRTLENLVKLCREHGVNPLIVISKLHEYKEGEE